MDSFDNGWMVASLRVCLFFHRIVCTTWWNTSTEGTWCFTFRSSGNSKSLTRRTYARLSFPLVFLALIWPLCSWFPATLDKKSRAGGAAQLLPPANLAFSSDHLWAIIQNSFRACCSIFILFFLTLAFHLAACAAFHHPAASWCHPFAFWFPRVSRHALCHAGFTQRRLRWASSSSTAKMWWCENDSNNEHLNIHGGTTHVNRYNNIHWYIVCILCEKKTSINMA